MVAGIFLVTLPLWVPAGAPLLEGKNDALLLVAAALLTVAVAVVVVWRVEPDRLVAVAGWQALYGIFRRE